ncbi:UDP-2,3-diacylglucosamine hydrolase, partial [Yersinia pestis PY-25]
MQICISAFRNRQSLPVFCIL